MKIEMKISLNLHNNLQVFTRKRLHLHYRLHIRLRKNTAGTNNVPVIIFFSLIKFYNYCYFFLNVSKNHFHKEKLEQPVRLEGLQLKEFQKENYFAQPHFCRKFQFGKINTHALVSKN